MRDVLRDRVVEVEQVPGVVLLIGGRVPDQFDALAQLAGQDLVLLEAGEDVATLLLRDHNVGQGVERGQGTVPTLDGGLKSVGDEADADAAGVLLRHADLAGEGDHAVGADEAHHAQLERATDDAVEAVLDGKPHADLVAHLELAGVVAEIIDREHLLAVTSDNDVAGVVGQTLGLKGVLGGVDEVAVLDDTIPLSDLAQHLHGVGAAVGDEAVRDKRTVRELHVARGGFDSVERVGGLFRELRHSVMWFDV